MFDYSTLKAHISKTTNDRNKWISDSEFRQLVDDICVGDVLSKGNIHPQKDAQKHCFIFPGTTLRHLICCFKIYSFMEVDKCNIGNSCWNSQV